MGLQKFFSALELDVECMNYETWWRYELWLDPATTSALYNVVKNCQKSVIVGNFAIHCASANTQSESVEMRIRLSLIGHLCQIVHATKS